MISATKLVYDFRRKWDSGISGVQRDIPLVDVIALLNEAQEIWFENRVIVAQTNAKVRDELRPFIENKVSLPCIDIDGKSCKITYPPRLYKRLNQLAVAVNDCCPQKEIIVRIVESDDLHEARQNPYRQSDFYYNQLIATEWKDGLIIYHEGKMTIENVIIDYYRKPKDIQAPSVKECKEGYYDYKGSIITADQDFEGDMGDKNISDIAVLLAARDMNNLAQFQTQLSKITQTQTFYKTD